MNWLPEYNYRVRGLWARRGEEQIIVFNLTNAVPAVLVNPEEEGKAKRRIELTPEEWTDDFGDEFYEHILENGLYYIAPKYEWHSQAKSVLAPGIEQYEAKTPESLQLSIESLRQGVEVENGQSRS